MVSLVASLSLALGAPVPKPALSCKLGPPGKPGPNHNTLSRREIRQGWKLLFDGSSTAGWHRFSASGIGEGWKVIEGELRCADPHTAGDIATDEIFGSFEMGIDFKVEKGQNSGIMFHVAAKGLAPWHSGPEIQIIDDSIVQPGGQKCGDLYDLISSKEPYSKPAGEWNTCYLKVTKKKSTASLNGKKLYDFQLDSPDFRARIQRSKFKVYPGFASLGKGSIALQGDHGVVAFRNIKIRPLKD